MSLQVVALHFEPRDTRRSAWQDPRVTARGKERAKGRVRERARRAAKACEKAWGRGRAGGIGTWVTRVISPKEHAFAGVSLESVLMGCTGGFRRYKWASKALGVG